MSVLSCSDLKVDGIFLAGFTEYLGDRQGRKELCEEGRPGR